MLRARRRLGSPAGLSGGSIARTAGTRPGVRPDPAHPTPSQATIGGVSSFVEGERDHLAEELDAAQAARAEADERARGAVERVTAETTRADRAEQAATAAREQVDVARGKVDELREQVGELRAAEATARAERDAVRAEVERERSHGEQRLTDLRTSFGEQLDELRTERSGLQAQVDQLRAAASKPKTQRKTQGE